MSGRKVASLDLLPDDLGDLHVQMRVTVVVEHARSLDDPLQAYLYDYV
jgi:hypothetical protein